MRVLTVLVFIYCFFNPATGNPSYCQDGFALLGKTCYRFSTNLRTYDEARGECEKRQSQLVTITDESKQQQIVNWIQRRGFRQQSYMTSLRYDPYRRVLKWAGDKRLRYQAWDAGYPSRESANPCVVLSYEFNFAWRNVRCDTLNLYVCEHDPLVPIPEPNVDLPDGGLTSFFCLGKYGYFAHPESCSSYILCYNDNMVEYACSPGKLFDARSQRCSETADCGTSSTTSHPVTTTPTTTTTTTRQTAMPAEIRDTRDLTCKGDYVKINDVCFKVYRDLKRWQDAEEFCQNEDNATLAMIRNEEESKFLVNMMFTFSSAGNPRDFWIGLNDRETHDEFVWTDGSVLGPGDYQSWSRQAKSRDGRFRACVAVSQTYKSKWIDQICSREFGFVCQTKAQPRRDRRMAPCRQCREDMPRAAAIVGGSRAQTGSYPWHVSLRNVSSHHICGGTLIDNCWVLTAAHCVTTEIHSYDPSKRVTHLLLGDYDLSTVESTELNLTFSQTIVHPKYNRAMPPVHDIALIRLTTCLSGSPVPICLGRSNQIDRSTCKVTGLGSTSASLGLYPNFLQEARVPLLSPRQCYKYYKKSNWIRSMVTADMLCAGYDEGGIDACLGDSGGPLFCEKSSNRKLVQIGIASWGIGCAKAKYPGVYMRMESYIDWIREITNIDF